MKTAIQNSTEPKRLSGPMRVILVNAFGAVEQGCDEVLVLGDPQERKPTMLFGLGEVQPDMIRGKEVAEGRNVVGASAALDMCCLDLPFGVLGFFA